MSEPEDDGLLAIEVDTDDYAETAAGDTPSVSRTYQSEADFQAQRASYSAKIDNGNIYAELLKTVPALQDYEQTEQLKLSKKETQLLGYAVGEMYYDRKYDDVVRLCDRVEQVCQVDGKLEESLGRWKERCLERIEQAKG